MPEASYTIFGIISIGATVIGHDPTSVLGPVWVQIWSVNLVPPPEANLLVNKTPLLPSLLGWSVAQGIISCMFELGPDDQSHPAHPNPVAWIGIDMGP